MTELSHFAKTAAVKIRNTAITGPARVHVDSGGRFYLPGKARPIGEGGVTELIKAGRLTPAGDGLLPETCQTYLLDSD